MTSFSLDFTLDSQSYSTICAPNTRQVWGKLGEMEEMEIVNAQQDFNDQIEYIFEDLIKIELKLVEVLDVSYYFSINLSKHLNFHIRNYNTKI